jgi:hypothetical protein
MKNYTEHDSKTIRVPRHISYAGLFSGQFLLAAAIVAFFYNYKRLAISTLLLYTTTIIYWNKMEYISFIKIADISMVFIVLFMVTFIDSYRFKKYLRQIWLLTLFIIAFVFTTNEYAFHYEVTPTKTTETPEHNNFVSELGLHYTYPNTSERESAYYWSCYLHMICLHILPSTVCSLCIIYSA